MLSRPGSLTQIVDPLDHRYAKWCPGSPNPSRSKGPIGANGEYGWLIVSV